MTTLGWDGAYSERSPGWDIGRPQPAFVRLADEGLMRGRVLDAGCGTGENALLAAARGADAVGVDISPVAIERARAKAAQRGLAARFEVGDVLSLGRPGLPFDTVIDAGAFHVFDDEDRVRYVTSLASVLRPGGACYLLCFSEHQRFAAAADPGPSALAGSARMSCARRSPTAGPSPASRLTHSTSSADPAPPGLRPG